MEPAKQIISLCGGVAVVSEWVGLNRTSVLRWMHPRSRGGTDGLIPSKHQTALLVKARENGVKLAPVDFFPAPRASNDTPPQEAAA